MLLECDALLFDLDGVLVDSTVAIEKLWSRWADLQGLDRATVLPTVHGRRAIDVIAEFTPDLDQAETLAGFEHLERDLLHDLKPMPGAGRFLATLPAGRWAIVTSGGRDTARARIAACDLPAPEVIVTADDVAAGKPDPAGYRLAAGRLGAGPGRCLVVEDAPAGIAAGLAAGCRVLAVATTHPAAQLTAATAMAPGLDRVRLVSPGPPLRLEIPDA